MYDFEDNEEIYLGGGVGLRVLFVIRGPRSNQYLTKVSINLIDLWTRSYRSQSKDD
jgi:hypothetical protein